MRGISTDSRPAATIGYRPGLDGLRALAVAAVILYHANVSWARAGFLGVDVFFVLSGFLITSRLADELSATGRIRFGLFYARRALRLLPALFVLLIVGTVWAHLFFPRELRESTTRGAVAAALYVANWLDIRGGEHALGAFGHTWSLSIEEQFYLIWPAMLLVIFTFRRRPAIVAAAALALAGYRAVLAMNGAGTWRLYNGFDTRCDGLILGAALALLLNEGEMPASLRRAAPIVSLLGVAALLLLLPSVTYQRRLTYVAVIPIVNVIAAAWIVVGTMREPTVMGRLLRAGPTQWLGKISYSLYLWHLPVLVALRYPPLDRVNIVAGIVVATALASMSYYGLEMPALRLKRRFESILAPRGPLAP